MSTSQIEEIQALSLFPNLRNTVFAKTSEKTQRYNCIAWAANDTNRFWWPSKSGVGYWPNSDDTPTPDVFHVAFGALGYLEVTDATLDAEYEKVALYFNPQTKLITHAARQLPDGYWTSKLGRFIDCTHELSGLEGKDYGVVHSILRRAIDWHVKQPAEINIT